MLCGCDGRWVELLVVCLSEEVKFFFESLLEFIEEIFLYNCLGYVFENVDIVVKKVNRWK